MEIQDKPLLIGMGCVLSCRESWAKIPGRYKVSLVGEELCGEFILDSHHKNAMDQSFARRAYLILQIINHQDLKIRSAEHVQCYCTSM